MSRKGLLLVLLVLGGVVACSSPEATRTRGGGPGADTGNRGEVVQMHGGSQPYWRTPHLIGDQPQGATRTARQSDQPGPAASPR